MRKLLTGALVVLGMALCIVLVIRTMRRPTPKPISNTTDPQWVHQKNPHATVALVFVHGIFGDTLKTWTSDNGTRFFDLVDRDPDLGPRVDSFAFGYTSKVIGSGSFDIEEAANRLHIYLSEKGVLDYPKVVFVAHSMGGLVVLRELLTHRELLKRVPLILFYSTPQEGAQIATIAEKVANNPALEQMLPADKDGYLRQLNDEWKALDAAERPHIRCAYEKQPTRGIMVVPWTSATRFCDGTTFAVDADHLAIVKPDGPEHASMVFLSDALKPVLPPDLTQTHLEINISHPDTLRHVLRLCAQSVDATLVLGQELDKLSMKGFHMRGTLRNVMDWICEAFQCNWELNPEQPLRTLIVRPKPAAPLASGSSPAPAPRH